MIFHVVIPARYSASRLPGKPLLDIAGKPMIQHVYERASEAGAASVIIATDDQRIADVVSGFGGECCMTSADHASGTDRLSEVIEKKSLADDEIVVNVQGDEPLIPPALIRQVAQGLAERPQASVSTLCERIATAGELFDPHVVKVVRDINDYAIYFSRAVIPWDRDAFSSTCEMLPERSDHYRHIGLYGYRCGFLRRYVTWPLSSLEQMESLEQLRVLWNGERIYVEEASEQPGLGVDTPRDLAEVRSIILQQQ
ncbi:MAG: 3-deoxy-manno-octulosonate cytidylyltransferase [Gammaproteobacteria bacterium]|nr:3-deoxy-manno-octulosonate cytidylyltransferase [Gammaproteobacteria bacterium]MCF6231194.1 3-deoxy-manno-octulosonate cytidylyltransferase [Gammaproteobacteria bacterium]